MPGEKIDIRSSRDVSPVDHGFRFLDHGMVVVKRKREIVRGLPETFSGLLGEVGSSVTDRILLG